MRVLALAPVRVFGQGGVQYSGVYGRHAGCTWEEGGWHIHHGREGYIYTRVG